MSTKLVNVFLDRVQRSGLIDEARLSQLVQELESRNVSLDDPTATAAALVDCGALTQWQTEKLLQGKHKGFFLGSYRLLRPLGKGGMGAVFLAQHEMMRRQCAIKVLPQTQIDKHSSVLERFYVEAQAVAALDHQNIVRAYDVSKEVKDNKEIHYLVMEYVEGQDAQVMVQENGPLDYVQAAEIIRQTANGLAHAHENGLIHRDIKPANLLIDKRGVVKILDLGLARFHDDSGAASLTAAHNETVLGTADYLSPEQALNSHNVDQRTDIYSLGCTAYFLLTGHPPFPEGSVAQRLVAHQVKQPQPISQQRADVPRDLTAIIDKMMAKSTADRFQSAGEIATCLAAWLIQYGGEDWRRQHSEITGDSSIMNLLPQHREPTRAMSAAVSETELELAPLDDDEADGSTVQPERTTASSKGSGRSSPAAGKSGGKLGQKGGDDVDLTLADETTAARADVAPPARLAPPGAAPTAAPAATVGLLDELPPLTASEAATPRSAVELLAELPLETALPSLGEVDLAEAFPSAETSLGALDSHVHRASARGPSSSSRLTPPGRQAEAKPKPAASGLKAIGLPILIGVGGGVALVLVIILLVLSSASVTETPVARSPSVAPPAAEQTAPPSDAEQDARLATTTTPDEAVAHTAAPETVPQGAAADGAEARSESKPPTVSKPDSSPGRTMLATADGTSEPRPVQVPPPIQIPAEKPDVPQLSPEPPPSDKATPDPRPTAKTTTQPPRKVEPVQPKPSPAASQRSKDELLAELTEMAVKIEFILPGGEEKTPKQVGPFAEEFRFLIRGTIEQMVSVKAVGIQVVNESDRGVMEIGVAPMVVAPDLIFSLSARAKCRSGESWVEVWSKPETEVVRFRPQVKMSATQINQIKRLWTDSIRDFFQDFRARRINAARGEAG